MRIAGTKPSFWILAVLLGFFLFAASGPSPLYVVCVSISVPAVIAGVATSRYGLPNTTYALRFGRHGVGRDNDGRHIEVEKRVIPSL